MPTTEPQKKGNSKPTRLQLVRFERTPEQLFDLELAEEIVALEVAEGQRPRRFYKMAEGELFPGRILARVVNDALHANIDPMAILRALWRPIRRLVERKSQRRLPTPPQGKFLPGA